MALFGITTNNARMFGDPSQGGGTPIDETRFGDPSATPTDTYCKYANVTLDCTVLLGSVSETNTIIGKNYNCTLVYNSNIEIRCTGSASCSDCKKFVNTLKNNSTGKKYTTQAGPTGGLIIKFNSYLGCCNCPGAIVTDNKQGTIPFKTVFLSSEPVDKVSGSSWYNYFNLDQIVDVFEDWLQSQTDLEDPCS